MSDKVYYKKINKNRKPMKLDNYISKLKENYNSSFIELDLQNKAGNNFILFLCSLNVKINKYNELNKQCLNLRDSNFDNYFSKFLTSEVNSSLNIENINSSKKIVNQILKEKKKENIWMQKDELDFLVTNMIDGMMHILNTNKIDQSTLYVLYSTLVRNINLKENALDENSFYRNAGVKIGNDFGVNHEDVPKMLSKLINFINSDFLNNIPIIKSLIAHYIFEYIHPYFDFNGRVGRMLHLWILKSINIEELWKNIYLSESIYAYKVDFYKAFNKMKSAGDLNIDLTLWISYLLDIFIKHNTNYIKMKKLANESKVPLNENAKLFLIDILIREEKNPGVWTTTKHFFRLYPEYSKTIANRIMQSYEKSKLFEVRGNKLKEYRIKKSIIQKYKK